MADAPKYGTIQQACRMIGGDEKPIHFTTYYRGVKAGLYPPPQRVSANVSRVDLGKLATTLRAGAAPKNDDAA